MAVKEAEHRPLMRARFAEWENRLDYWHIHDVEDETPAEALKLLAEEVRTLLRRLPAAGSTVNAAEGMLGVKRPAGRWRGLRYRRRWIWIAAGR